MWTWDAKVTEALRQRSRQQEWARVATATALLLDRLGELVGAVGAPDEAAAQRLAADMLEVTSE